MSVFRCVDLPTSADTGCEPVRVWHHGEHDPEHADAWRHRHAIVLSFEGDSHVRLAVRNCGMPPGRAALAEACDLLCLHLAPDWLDRIAAGIYGPCDGPVVLQRRVDVEDEEIALVGRALMREAVDAQPGTRVALDALGQQLAVALLRRHVAAKPWEHRRATFKERQRCVVIDYIERNLARDLSVEALARQVHLSTDQFSRLFHATFGCAPHRHVMRQRVQRACELLAEPSRTIAEVAIATGFADQSHLARCFKREFGEAPGAWRARHEAGRAAAVSA